MLGAVEIACIVVLAQCGLFCVALQRSRWLECAARAWVVRCSAPVEVAREIEAALVLVGMLDVLPS